MPRGQPSLTRGHRRAWYGALFLCAVLSLLPSRALLGWTSDIAGVVGFPLVPLQHTASAVRHWLRPIPDPRAADPEVIRALESDRDRAIAEAKRLEIEREEILARIALLERTPPAALRVPGARGARTIYAAVVATQSPSSRSSGSLTVNAGTRNGIVPGMVATWDGDIVVGRVGDNPGRLTSIVLPIESLSGFEVRFFPTDRDLTAAAAPGGVLKATRDGLWTVDLTQPGEITEGWVARIADERWPGATRGMRVGVVESVGTRDDAPLVRRLSVRPLAEALRVPHVVLVDDVDSVDDSASESAGLRGAPNEPRPSGSPR